MSLRTGTSGELLWIWRYIFGFHKRWGNQGDHLYQLLCCMQLARTEVGLFQNEAQLMEETNRNLKVVAIIVLSLSLKHTHTQGICCI